MDLSIDTIPLYMQTVTKLAPSTPIATRVRKQCGDIKAVEELCWV